MILSNSWFFMLFAPYFCCMESTLDPVLTPEMLSFEAFKKSVLEDYRIALMSREVSLLGRREVLTGKAKFGIFGDGKEIAQVALAKFFQKGDLYLSNFTRCNFFIGFKIGGCATTTWTCIH